MTDFSRVLLDAFILDNVYYAGATVTVYTVDSNGDRTSTEATLYAGITGADELENPQQLGSRGQFLQSIYVDEPVILRISGLSTVPDHDTGILGNVAGTALASAQEAAAQAISFAELARVYASRARTASTGFVLRTGDTMTGALQVPNGSDAAPGLAIGAADRGIFSTSSGIGISTGGVTAAFVDTSQNVGIGTAGPTNRLHLRKDQAGATGLVVQNDDTAGVVGVYLRPYNYGTNGDSSFISDKDNSALRGGGRPLILQAGATNRNTISMAATLSSAGAVVMEQGSAGVPALKMPNDGQYIQMQDAGIIQSASALGIGGTYFSHGIYHHTAVGPKYVKTGEAASIVLAGPGAIDFYTAPAGTAGAAATLVRQAQINHVASAANYWQLAGAASGTPVFLNAAGSDANVNGRIYLKGDGVFAIETGAAGIGLIVSSTGGVAEADRIRIQSDNGRATIKGDGGSTDIDIRITPKGSGVVDFTGPSTATVGAAGAATALPANPVGYLSVKIAGTAYKIPYYNT